MLFRSVRIWPHRMDGEGHFLALLKKSETALRTELELSRGGQIDKGNRKVLEEFFQKTGWQPKWDWLEIRGDKVYQVPQLPQNLKGIHFLRNGLYMGELKKKRFEPSQQLAMVLRKDQYPGVLSLDSTDERIERYLRGETILVERGEATREKGWILVCVENFSLGWGKLVNGVLKNKYWGGWRKK